MKTKITKNKRFKVSPVTPKQLDVLRAFYYLDNMLPREAEPFALAYSVTELAAAKKILGEIVRELTKKYEIPPTIHEMVKVFKETCVQLQKNGLLEAGHVGYEPPCYRLTLLGFATCHEKTLSAIRKHEREQRMTMRKEAPKENEEMEIW